MVYIIGSGLSSIAAASALIARGIRPTILDAGLEPEAFAEVLKLHLASVEPEDWSREDITRLKSVGPTAANGIPRKLYFGSDFSFSEARYATHLDLKHASMHRSFAMGGFSNVWGAVVQPLPPDEINDWPVSFGELAPHYAAVRRLLCDPAADDSLCRPGFSETGAEPSIRPSTQAQALYSDLVTGRAHLARQGIRFEYASLAVRAADRNGDKGCRYCGLCLLGCPYDCRYSARTTLERLVREGKVRYIPGVIVQKLFSAKGHISIEVRSLARDCTDYFSARRVLVGAGLLETSRLVMASLGLYDTPLVANHSDIFTLPVVRYAAAPSVFEERLHTLCQLVGEIADARISEHPVHLQIYGYNDLYLSLLRGKFGPSGAWFTPALKSLASRLFVIFGYLHSDISSKVMLTLQGNGAPRLTAEGCGNPMAAKISRQVARTILTNHKYFRAIPVPFHARLDLPGGGYHSGGSLPMSANPQALQTDRLGRLPSLPGVHLIDASILPTVPAGTTAFTVMANAHRIASELEAPEDA
jgi:choline dehydrogenase-like flavoprotein